MVLQPNRRCNHQGCELAEWLTASRSFQCSCHATRFDARNQGNPVHGPARRHLAILPLKLPKSDKCE